MLKQLKSLPTSRRFHLTPIGILAITFIASRVIYVCFLDVHFNHDTLEFYIQILDPYLLKTDLLRSVYYLHFQPPAFNLFLGAMLKLFPENYSFVFQCLYLLMGFAFSVVLFGLLESVGVSHKLALTLAVIHTVIPTTILYENWLFYSYPLALLLCASAYFLARFTESHRPRFCLLFFASIGLISFIHAMYGIFWFIAIFIVMILINTRRRTLIVRCAALPLAALLLLAIKQYAVFGNWTTGTAYTGPNLAYRLTLLGDIPPEVQQSLIKSGEVPPFFFEFPLRPISFFRDHVPRIPPTGIPVLDQELKSTDEINLNHMGYLTVGDAYLQGAIKVIRRHPEYYLRTFRGTSSYFKPASDDPHIRQPTKMLLERLVVLGNFIGSGQVHENRPGWFLVAGFPFLLLFGLRLVSTNFKERPQERVRYIVPAYLLLNILYSTLLPALITWGDWNRYRFDIDSFYLVLLGLMLTSIFQHLTRAVPHATTPIPNTSAQAQSQPSQISQS